MPTHRLDGTRSPHRRSRAVEFTFRPMRLRDALAAVRWRYPGAYAFYDPGLSPIFVWLIEQPLRLFGLTVYYGVWNERGELTGIFSFAQRAEDIEIGVALRPDLTGQGRGIGLAFVEAGLAFARRRLAPKRFTLDVATFNTRAMRVYERAGFRPTRTIVRRTRGRSVEYLEMEREA